MTLTSNLWSAPRYRPIGEPAAKALAAEGGDAVILRLVVPAVDGAATMLQPEQDASGQSSKKTAQETSNTAYVSGIS